MDESPFKAIVTVALVSVGIVAVLAGSWFGFWALKGAATHNDYQINNRSQQYQQSLIMQERDRVTAYNAATDDSQKAYIKAQFCQIYPDLDPAPTDLEMAHQQIC